MVEELFDFSVDTSAELELRREAVDVNRLLQESLAAFYANFQEYQITPEIHMTEVRIIRQADAAALGRVFSNLLGNALKYSDGDLEVVLRDDGEILFANTAAGLSHVEVERLFDRFYTVEKRPQVEGAGAVDRKTADGEYEGADHGRVSGSEADHPPAGCRRRMKNKKTKFVLRSRACAAAFFHVRRFFAYFLTVLLTVS